MKSFANACKIGCSILLLAVGLKILLNLIYVVPYLLGTGMDKPDSNHPGRMISAYESPTIYALEFVSFTGWAVFLSGSYSITVA